MASNPNKTLADQIVEAHNTGKEAVITYNGTDYNVNVVGLVALIVAVLGGSEDVTAGAITATDLTATGDVIFSNLPTADPTVAGQLWSNSGVLTVSAGA